MSYYGPSVPLKLLAILLCGTLVLPLPLAAQQQQAPPPLPATTPDSAGLGRRLPPGGIRILVLEGQNMLNSLQSRSAISPVVQILDSQDQPVAGATVTFEVSPTGPGGGFGIPPAPLAPLMTVRSDFAGQATSHFTPNTTPGRFTIKVVANMDGQTAQAAIAQTNDPTILFAGYPPQKKRWFQNWKWWAVIGGGATAAIILLTRKGDPTITITPSPVGIGGPR